MVGLAGRGRGPNRAIAIWPDRGHLLEYHFFFFLAAVLHALVASLVFS